MSERRVITNLVCPPIPDSRFDWSATRDGYEPGEPIGWGKTKQEAIDDLLIMEADAEDFRRGGIEMNFAD